MTLDSVKVRIHASAPKLQECRTLLEEAAELAVIPAKCLAKVLGKARALETALGPGVQLLMRSAQSELAATVKAAHWGVTVWLFEDARNFLVLPYLGSTDTPLKPKPPPFHCTIS